MRIGKIVLITFFLTLTGFPVSAQESPPASQRTPDFRSVADACDAILRSHVFDAAQLKRSEYAAVVERMSRLAAQSVSIDSFIKESNAIWSDGPFSHVRIDRARMNERQLADFLDTMNVSRPGAVLTWRDDIAILTVYTMMGQNTIRQIGEAYSAITERKARALIIDLRKNEGGAFAVVPLVGHLLTADLEAGFFLSRKWTDTHSGIPSQDLVRQLPPWKGWSIKSFWQDVQEKGILRIVFKPMKPHYAGPVYVLTGRRTASAAELAADALLASGRGVLMGEKTAGKMLSQRMYDLPEGLQFSVPIADYYAYRTGRIEGTGVTPSIVVAQDEAMEQALERARAENGMK